MRTVENRNPGVFVHVPRTGGSCIWHYLTRACSKECNFLDVHHEARVRLGHERYAFQAMSMFMSDVRRVQSRVLIHHHGVAPLNSLLETATYFTILRKPVDRLLSYFNHVKAQQRMGNRTNEIAAQDLSILDFYRQTPWHLVGYCSWFGAMMWEKAGMYPKEFLLDVLVPPPQLILSINREREGFVDALAEYMDDNFALIADFDKISATAKQVARYFSPETAPPDLPDNINCIYDPISAGTLAELESMCALDTKLFNQILLAWREVA